MGTTVNVTRNQAPVARAAARPWAVLWLPLLVLLLAAGLRLLNLGAQSYWVDEITMIQVTAGDWAGVLEEFELSAGKLIGRPPLYTLLGYFWTQLFGTDEALVRLLSVFAGILATALLYRLGVDLFDRQVSLIATLVMAVSMYQIHFAQEHRYYGVLVLVTLACLFFYWRALRTGRWRDFIGFIVFGILIFYAHPLGMFVLVAPGLHFIVLLVWQRRSYRPLLVPWFISQVVIIAGAGVWLVLQYLSQFGAGGDAATALATPTEWISVPSWRAPLYTMVNFLVKDQYNYLNGAAVLLGVVTLAAGTVAYALWRRQTYTAGLREPGADLKPLWQERRSALLLIGLWLVLPLLLFFIAARLGQPFYLDRYMIGLAPAFYLWIGVAVMAVRRLIPTPVLLLALLIPVVYPLTIYYGGTVREQWREAAAYVAAHVAPGDVIAFGVDIGRLGDIITARDSFNWYYPGETAECYINADQDHEAIVADLATCGATDGSLWYVVRNYNPSRMAEWQDFLAESSDDGLHWLASETFTGITVYQVAWTP